MSSKAGKSPFKFDESLMGPGGLVVGGATKESQGVVYLSHLPHGFYEDQMKGFFGYFGTVSRLRLARSKKSGRSRGYAYVEFASKAVADIVATTMNGYYLVNKYVRARSLSADQVHPRLFVGAHRKFRWIPWRLNEKKRREKTVSAESLDRRVRKLLSGEVKLRKALEEKGIDYAFGGYSEAVVRAIYRREELLEAGELAEPAAAPQSSSSAAASAASGAGSASSGKAASSSSAGDSGEELDDEGEDSEGSEGEVDLDDEEAMLARLERIVGTGPDSGGVVLEAEQVATPATPAKGAAGKGKKGAGSGAKKSTPASSKASGAKKSTPASSKASGAKKSTPASSKASGKKKSAGAASGSAGTKRKRSYGDDAGARTPKGSSGKKVKGSAGKKAVSGAGSAKGKGEGKGKAGSASKRRRLEK